MHVRYTLTFTSEVCQFLQKQLGEVTVPLQSSLSTTTSLITGSSRLAGMNVRSKLRSSTLSDPETRKNWLAKFVHRSAWIPLYLCTLHHDLHKAFLIRELRATLSQWPDANFGTFPAGKSWKGYTPTICSTSQPCSNGLSTSWSLLTWHKCISYWTSIKWLLISFVFRQTWSEPLSKLVWHKYDLWEIFLA